MVIHALNETKCVTEPFTYLVFGLFPGRQTVILADGLSRRGLPGSLGLTV